MRSILAIATTVALSAILAGSAHAENVAGWDFSQYARDGATAGSLDANYSSFDATGNAGAESATYGSATLSNIVGRGGNVEAGIRIPNPVPATASGTRQNANEDGPATVIGDNSFNNYVRLQIEGQTHTNDIAITAPSTAGEVVFEGDLTSLVDTTGYGWSVSFGAEVVGGTSANVDVQYAADCSSYGAPVAVAIDDQANEYTVGFTKVASTNACVRMTIPNTTGQRAVVDNVSLDVIAVPEPAMGAQLLAGVVGLVAMFRRRA